MLAGSPRRRLAGARTLRRLLAAIVVSFVAFPLVIYHFFTFDFHRVPTTSAISRRFADRFSRVVGDVATNQSNVTTGRDDIIALPRCLSLPSEDFLTSGGVHSIGEQCGAEGNASHENDSDAGSTAVLVHYAHVPLSEVPRFPGDPQLAEDPDERFTYLSFAALQSVQRMLKPELIFLHYITRPRGVWFTQCQRYLSLHNVLPPIAFAQPTDAQIPPLSLEKRRQILQLLLVIRALRKQGGVGFVDFNTLVLRPSLTALEQPDLFVASQTTSFSRFGVGLHMIQAPANHPLLSYIEQQISLMVTQPDSILYKQPLERVVGQLILDKSTEASSQDFKVAIGAPYLSEPASASVQQLLITPIDTVDTSLVGILRHSVAFNLDPNDCRDSRTSSLCEAFDAVRQNRTTAADWLSLDTVFGGVLRFVVGANVTDELGI